jgi:hypothetical protein
VKAAVKGFEEALDELMQKKGILCRVASSSLNEIGDRLLEEKRKFVMMGNHPDDFTDTPQSSWIFEVSEYLEEITGECNRSLQRLISFINSKA